MKIRTRLTLLYAGAFFVAGALLVALMFFYLQISLSHRPANNARALFDQAVDQRGLGRMPVIERVVDTISEQAARERRETLRAMLVFSLASLGVVGLLAGLIGWLLAGRVLAPLHDVTATARRVADLHLSERISMTGPDDEIKVLADTFDDMLERLDRAFDGQRHFVANASHELRTPLAINRTLIEVALDDSATPESTRRLGATLLAVNHRQERLIDGLLVLASSQRRLETRTRVNLAEVTERAIGAARAAADTAGVSLVADLHPAVTLGDPTLLERLAGNLIDNAIRYNSSEGWVRVVVAMRGARAVLVVENSGPVVAPGDVAGLLEPFRRHGADGPDSRTGGGTGLGLSIVRSIATAHGGALRLTARQGGGLVVEVELPGAQ
ncbi:sensor histidine kinase [Mycolicibacterium arenosum]|uniref:histidine kinase n=1 Tax=Mycolicibacterium arenosum TaxID=2952157 RepID=A0ABT1M9R1_9MYCO|nr:ATP-binding protein [Mycolicibacterium sp. CAU 1645]MCP9275911.1 ATP-binding protein [Mycolicibacterium sp. CAU 1645]